MWKKKEVELKIRFRVFQNDSRALETHRIGLFWRFYAVVVRPTPSEPGDTIFFIRTPSKFGISLSETWLWGGSQLLKIMKKITVPLGYFMSPLYNWGAISCQKNRFWSLKTCFVITGTFRVIIGTISGKSKFWLFHDFFHDFQKLGTGPDRGLGQGNPRFWRGFDEKYCISELRRSWADHCSIRPSEETYPMGFQRPGVILEHPKPGFQLNFFFFTHLTTKPGYSEPPGEILWHGLKK